MLISYSASRKPSSFRKKRRRRRDGFHFHFPGASLADAFAKRHDLGSVKASKHTLQTSCGPLHRMTHHFIRRGIYMIIGLTVTTGNEVHQTIRRSAPCCTISFSGPHVQGFQLCRFYNVHRMLYEMILIFTVLFGGLCLLWLTY